MAEKTGKETSDFLESGPEDRETARALQRMAEIEEREFERAQEDHRDLEAPPGFLQRVMDRIDQEGSREIDDQDPILLRSLQRLGEAEEQEFEQAQTERRGLQAPEDFAARVLREAGVKAPSGLTKDATRHADPDNESVSLGRRIWRWVIHVQPAFPGSRVSPAWAWSFAAAAAVLMVTVSGTALLYSELQTQVAANRELQAHLAANIAYLGDRVSGLESNTLTAAVEVRPLNKADPNAVLFCGEHSEFFTDSRGHFDIQAIRQHKGVAHSLPVDPNVQACPEHGRQHPLVVFLHPDTLQRLVKPRKPSETHRPLRAYVSRSVTDKVDVKKYEITRPQNTALLPDMTANPRLQN